MLHFVPFSRVGRLERDNDDLKKELKAAQCNGCEMEDQCQKMETQIKSLEYKVCTKLHMSTVTVSTATVSTVTVSTVTVSTVTVSTVTASTVCVFTVSLLMHCSS